jgi:diketogulonate reductase-like aldo/keto reductase
MLKKLIPSTDEPIPVIGLGTWSTFDFEDRNKKEQALTVVKKFNLSGGALIDSSPMYGEAETRVGEISQELSIRNNLFMATKVWTIGKQQGIQQMDESFAKMKVNTMDLMQVHNFVDVKTHMETLREWKAKGKIRYTGITHYTIGAYDKLMELIKTEKPDFVQFNYNVGVREAEKKLLPLAKEHGVAVMINRPFEEGNLFSSVKEKALPPWAKEYNITSWAQYFLKYIISHEAVTCVIPATRNITHLEDFIQAGDGVLPDENTRKKMISYLKEM